MKSILTITDRALDQIKKIVNDAPQGTTGIKLGVSQSGCNGYSYEMGYASNSDVLDFDCIESNGIKVYIDPKAVMFLIGSEMDYTKDKIASRFV